MARRSFAVREIAEILDHWQRGRSVTAIAESLNLDRKTVHKYVGLAPGAGFIPGQAPPDGWGRWLTLTYPELTAKGRYRPTASVLVPVDAEIRQLLDQVTPPRPGGGSSGKDDSPSRWPASATTSATCYRSSSSASTSRCVGPILHRERRRKWTTGCWACGSTRSLGSGERYRRSP